MAPPAYDAYVGYFPIEGNHVAAYDLITGTQRWLVSGRSQSQSATGSDLLFLDQTDALVALRVSDGSVAWQLPLSAALIVPLVWSNGWLVATTGTAMHAFRPADGHLLWSRDVPSPARAAPELASDRIYLPVEDGRVMAYRLNDGERVWERRLGGPANAIRASDDRLFVGSNDNFLYCLNASDGQVVWRSRTGADVVSPPVVDDHRVYFVSLDNVLRGLNRTNGVQQWKRVLPFRPAWGPIKAADTLIVTGAAGPLRAFYMKDGMPAGEVDAASGAEMAAQPYAFRSPVSVGPTIVAVTRHLASGATVIAASRSVEPPFLPSLQALPGLVPVTAASPP